MSVDLDLRDLLGLLPLLLVAVAGFVSLAVSKPTSWPPQKLNAKQKAALRKLGVDRP